MDGRGIWIFRSGRGRYGHGAGITALPHGARSSTSKGSFSQCDSPSSGCRYLRYLPSSDQDRTAPAALPTHLRDCIIAPSLTQPLAPRLCMLVIKPSRPAARKPQRHLFLRSSSAVLRVSLHLRLLGLVLRGPFHPTFSPLASRVASPPSIPQHSQPQSWIRRCYLNPHHDSSLLPRQQQLALGCEFAPSVLRPCRNSIADCIFFSLSGAWSSSKTPPSSSSALLVILRKRRRWGALPSSPLICALR